MSQWIKNNREAFERDVLQDFCLAWHELSEQFARMRETGTISFPVLRSLVGDNMGKGLLWRLKDKAHHLLREAEEYTSAGLLLDWTLGYIFHESMKLMEDAHQYQYYVPRLAAFSDQQLPPDVAQLLGNLMQIQYQTEESIKREGTRLEGLFLQCRKLFCLYFADQPGHRPLARLLYDRSELVRDTFQEDYRLLVEAVYGLEPERLYIEAALSLMESARTENSRLAIEHALAVNPHSRQAREVAEQLYSV